MNSAGYGVRRKVKTCDLGVVFFYQEEDGMRDGTVTGVQTCALPICLCSSAFLLGAAGVLDGRRATTHWALASQFRQRFPLVNLQIEQLVCEDGQLLSSGGANAGLDLCLHLIRQHAGDALAQQAANTLVFDSQRGQQSRFAPLLPAPSKDCQLASVLQWLH